MLIGGCVLRVGVIGINVKTADLLVRELIAKAAQNLSGERSLFFPHPIVLLSTCNRTEIYFSATDLAEAQSDLLSFLRKHINIPFEHLLYSYFGVDCFAHLGRVTAGLDSPILGETEIQRQVKVAYLEASSTRSLPATLHYLFQKALKIGKAVRSRFNLDRSAPTLFGTLWELGSAFFETLARVKVLLVGYSEIHRGFASYLTHRGLTEITFCTRSSSRLGLYSWCGREALNHWNRYDWISCASSSGDFLIRGEGRRRHLVFDLSVPRNVDPSIQGVTLYNMEQINRMIEEKRGKTSALLHPLEAFIWDQVLLLSRIYRDKVYPNNLKSWFLATGKQPGPETNF